MKLLGWGWIVIMLLAAFIILFIDPISSSSGGVGRGTALQFIGATTIFVSIFPRASRTYLNFIGLLLAATFACLGILIVLLEESPELFALIMIVTMPYLIVMFVIFVWTKLFYPLWSWLKQFFNSN